jgi:SET domain-containing protein
MEKKYYRSNSNIHGQGVFAMLDLTPDEPIDVGIDHCFWIIPYVTDDFGSYINHSWTPNTYLEYDKDEHKYWIKAIGNISANEELTLDYQKTPWFILGPGKHYK